MRFLVEQHYKQAPNEAIMALIPAEMARGKELEGEGVRERLYIAADYSAAWQVFRCETPQHLERVLQSFPLAAYLDSRVTSLVEA